MDRLTKIVATIGPASHDEDTIHRLIKMGMSVARLNLSHGTHQEHTDIYHRLRDTANKLGVPLCILLDLQGPKIRIGKIPGDEIFLNQGQIITLSTELDPGKPGVIPVDFFELTRSVTPGGRILLDDGNIELSVESSEHQAVRAKVVVGGVLKSHKGISLPDARLEIPALTKKDLTDLEFGLNLGVDAVAVSFVRSENDIQLVRDEIVAISPTKKRIPIIAKLERPEALTHLEAIVEAADGVMVARGDLGVEMSPQEVPIAQKRIIECANRHAKVVITATQMLESMIHKPRPTRAEASDVANAIFDGTDAVMLSGETAIGEYPVGSVEMMSKIICTAEPHVDEWGHWKGPSVPICEGDDTLYVALAVRELAHDRNVAAIAVFTMSGRTALTVSKTRPVVPILAYTPETSTYNRMAMYWGVTPYKVPHSNTLEELIENVDRAIKETGEAKPGQQVVLTCGFPVAMVSPTNLVLIHTIEG